VIDIWHAVCGQALDGTEKWRPMDNTASKRKADVESTSF
jgi:hypothetical protein